MSMNTIVEEGADVAKDINLTFRVTEEFDRQLRVECKEVGMEMSAYIRAAFMFGRAQLLEYPVLRLIRLEDTIQKK